jgi:hypothetical protein
MPAMQWPEVLAGPLILSSPSCLAARSRLGSACPDHSEPSLPSSLYSSRRCLPTISF